MPDYMKENLGLHFWFSNNSVLCATSQDIKAFPRSAVVVTQITGN